MGEEGRNAKPLLVSIIFKRQGEWVGFKNASLRAKDLG